MLKSAISNVVHPMNVYKFNEKVLTCAQRFIISNLKSEFAKLRLTSEVTLGAKVALCTEIALGTEVALGTDVA